MNYSKAHTRSPTSCSANRDTRPPDLANCAIFLPAEAAAHSANLQNLPERSLVQLVAYYSRGPRARDGFAVLTLSQIAVRLAAVFTSTDAVSRNLRALVARGVLDRKQFGARLHGYRIAEQLQDSFPATQRGAVDRVRYQCLTHEHALALDLVGATGAQTLARHLFRISARLDKVEHTAAQLQTLLPATLPTEHAARTAVRNLEAAGVVLTTRGNRATRFYLTKRGAELAAVYEPGQSFQHQAAFEFDQATGTGAARPAKIPDDSPARVAKIRRNPGPTCENPGPKEREPVLEHQTTRDDRACARPASTDSAHPSHDVTTDAREPETMTDKPNPYWPPRPNAVTMKRHNIWPEGWSEFIEAAGGFPLWRAKFRMVGRGTIAGYLREFPQIAMQPAEYGAIARWCIEDGQFDRGPYGDKCNTLTLLENVACFADPVADLAALKRESAAAQTPLERFETSTRTDGPTLLWRGLAQHYPKRANLEAAAVALAGWCDRNFPSKAAAAEILRATRERFRSCSSLHNPQYWPALEKWIVDERWLQMINHDHNARAPENVRARFAEPWPGEEFEQ